ncbi:(2Fe-2S)-binding protein [Salsipaludibacter albus]|uniref:(2Fe-2S)-binding protein n=1 Tax=Salsipaludibacter albus TaxID=2849650 RepID=UPI001EE3A496|nr:(2Fe-2S)-binding protein [Salsipaludibacter albus]MBY5163018.1 (2Fe-2S)-binding protein [Salsipaludibacter albus]
MTTDHLPSGDPGGTPGHAHDHGSDLPADLVESTHAVSVTVNGRLRRATVPARRLLSDFLRHDLGLTGTHVGCEHGVCGCCTVLLDGAAVRACLLLAVGVDGRAVTTIEGLAAEDGTLHPVQQAFHDEHGLQCGFCTPGFVMSACDFLADNATPTRAEIREGMSGNLCRCTGYQNITAAVETAAARLAETGQDPRARCAGNDPDSGSGAVARARMGATPNEAGTTGRGPAGQGPSSTGALDDGPGDPGSAVGEGDA